MASCAMVVRMCVRNAFSGTDAPSAVNRLPHSSSTAGPVNPVGTLADNAFGARAGDKPIRNRPPTIRTYALRLVVIRTSSASIAASGNTGQEVQPDQSPAKLASRGPYLD